MLYESAIEVEGISKTYKVFETPIKQLFGILLPNYCDKFSRKVHVLKEISFTVYKGETFGILGRNGAGKSTLLQIICGILEASSGKVSLNGRLMALLELGSGLNREYTGLQNIVLGAAIWGYTDAELEDKKKSIIKFCELGSQLNDQIKTYSTGMLMRLAFSIAIHFDPDILVIDEALAVGDELFQAKCYRKIEELKGRGVTILFVSHSMFTVNKMCDRAILLHDGKVVAMGAAKSVTEEYNKLLYSLDTLAVTGNHQDPNVSLDVVETQTVGKKIPISQSNSIGHLYEVGVKNRQYQNLLFEIGEQVTFYSKLKLFADTNDLILGMMITTPIGVDCYHTNLLCKDYCILNSNAGAEHIAEFNLSLNLNPGKYIVVFDAQYDLNITAKLVDIVYEALYFEIRPTKRFEDGGIAALNASITIR